MNVVYPVMNVQGTPTHEVWVSGVPSNALLDENGLPILDENGNFILLD